MRLSRRSGRCAGIGAAATLAAGLLIPLSIAPGAALASPPSDSIVPASFAAPPIGYRPGVRWWWPGNAASTEDLLAQLDYLHDNGFGAVEIVAFAKDFYTEGPGPGISTIYDARDAGHDEAAILGYETPAYFEKLDAVIKRANKLGITVDLNIGSGYLASDDSVDVSESQSNLALGRATVAFDGSQLAVTSGDVEAGLSDANAEISIPGAEASPFYVSQKAGMDFGIWDTQNVKLTAVVLAPITAPGAALPRNNQVVTKDFTAVKTYDRRTVVDLANSKVFYPEQGDTQISVPAAELTQGSYEVIAMYSLPTGSFAINGVIDNGENGQRNHVVDHLDPEAIKAMIGGWLGDPRLKKIITTRDVRAGFNDSYEFYTDTFYNDLIQNAAKSEEILGYDVTKFVPAMYQFYQQSFLLGSVPAVKQEFLDLGMKQPAASGASLLASSLPAAETQRVQYDYNRLVNEGFLSGMDAFSDSLGEFGLVYRQQAYNPPLDTLKAAEFVDIPETEGLSEYSLKRVSSGAHLYGKDLVTSEVYTLGSTPFNVTPDFIKRGFDLMATSGVNNFFYHGLNAPYHGNKDPEFTSDDNLYPEEGWRAWGTIGVEMADTDPTHDYYKSMNAYASRANYLMQQGKASADVAVYMPLFGNLSATASVAALQSRGFQWDAINDDTIQNSLKWDGEHLIANGGAMRFDALVLQSATVPVETMTALRDLQDAGAPIYLVGVAPSAQPGYADGAYAALDAQVAALAGELGDVLTPAALVGIVEARNAAPISFAENSSVRSMRRELAGGGEIAYVRNTSVSAPTTISFDTDPRFASCYWLDPDTGRIHQAGLLEDPITLEASGAVAILCDPSKAAFKSKDVSAGVPENIDASPVPVVIPVDGFELTVTADNIGKRLPGETETRTYKTGDVLGSWANDAVLGGELKYVASKGTYRTTIDVRNAETIGDGRAVLDLGSVRDAATVRVNPGTSHELTVQLYSAPFRTDISAALVTGENVVEIDVQPVKNNRRQGLKQLYAEAPALYPQYASYSKAVGGSALVPAGLVGPVTVSLPEGADTAAPKLPTSIQVTAQTLGGKARLSVAVTNEAAVPIDIAIATAYGNKTYRNVAPGKTVTASVNSALAAIPAGEVTITASGTLNGGTVTETQTVPHGAFPTAP
ncbi:glycosyl hydrolase [Microbacterium sp. F51-2R]|uniref:glycosyl hydrolase n=1 Tax=Microbacterium sp. F51-2R TaxID=3445777 RepID=UPI003FA0D478